MWCLKSVANNKNASFFLQLRDCDLKELATHLSITVCVVAVFSSEPVCLLPKCSPAGNSFNLSLVETHLGPSQMGGNQTRLRE